MAKYFGTDGIRGLANADLSAELAFKAGRAVSIMLRRDCRKPGKPVVLIGRDTRISGTMLESALSAGIASAGCDVLLAGIVPTPAVAYLTKSAGADCGVVISASHNPAQDNGIKFFNREGFKFSDYMEEQIESLIDMEPEPGSLPTGGDVGEIKVMTEADLVYEEYVKSLYAGDFEGFSIAMDCANGATSKVALTIFSELGVKLLAVNSDPDGININQQCGSTHPELLCKIVKAGSYNAGFAFDGDGDRFLAVDEEGQIVDGDELINIFALDLHKKGLLKNNIVVATVMSNIGLELSLREKGITLERSGVGDKMVLEKMKETGASLGGEQSGHIIFLDENTTGDGILSALHLLILLKETGEKLSSLKKLMKRYPQSLKNIPVKDKKAIIDNVELKRYLSEKGRETKDKYRILVRPSGTESKIRVMVEGPDESSTAALVEEICKKIIETDAKLQGKMSTVLENG